MKAAEQSPKAKPQELPEDDEEEIVKPVPKTKPSPKAKQQKLPDEDEEDQGAKKFKVPSQPMNASFGLMQGHIISGEKLLAGEQSDEEQEVVKPKQVNKAPVKKAPAKKVAAKPRGRRGGFSNSDLSFDDEE